LPAAPLLALALILLCAPAAEAKGKRKPIPNDGRDLAIRTIIGEAETEPRDGKIAVAHVILNRLRSGQYGRDLRAVVLARHQFEPWSRRRRELLRIKRTDSRYREAAEIFDQARFGVLPDITRGATHFANVEVVKARGDSAGRPGGWLSRLLDALQIGRHTFGKAS
jgi:hypothetical protein